MKKEQERKKEKLKLKRLEQKEKEKTIVSLQYSTFSKRREVIDPLKKKKLDDALFFLL